MGRPPEHDRVDRPDVDASQDVKLTGTNEPNHPHPPQTKKRGKQQEPRVHSTTPEHHTQHPTTVWAVATATETRPDPSRTRKLSLPAPMVLHPPGCGRVGHHRPPHKHKNGRHQTPLNPSLLTGPPRQAGHIQERTPAHTNNQQQAERWHPGSQRCATCFLWSVFLCSFLYMSRLCTTNTTYKINRRKK